MPRGPRLVLIASATAAGHGKYKYTNNYKACCIKSVNIPLAAVILLSRTSVGFSLSLKTPLPPFEAIINLTPPLSQHCITRALQLN